MDTINCIKTRRSTRAFQEKKVDTKLIEKIVDIARFAPSWKNSQTTSYIAISNEKMKQSVIKYGFAESPRNGAIIDNAPMVVVVLTKNKISGYSREGVPTDRGDHWQSFDAGIATDTFVLAAHELGLATLIMGIFDEKGIKKALDIDDTYNVATVLAVGYATNVPTCPPRREVSELLTIIE